MQELHVKKNASIVNLLDLKILDWIIKAKNAKHHTLT